MCFIQEAETPVNYPNELLNLKNYKIEIEHNSERRRGMITYLRAGVPYVIRVDLEGLNKHLVIIDK